MDNNNLIPKKVIENKILVIRNQKVMIDAELSNLYNVTTKRLNEQVKRNLNRFPTHFMFELSQEEKDKVVAKCDHLNKLKFSPYLPKVFTEHGVLMLANVLKSEQAINVSIKIIEVFVKLRETILTHKGILLKLNEIESQTKTHNDQILLLFEYIKQFEEIKQQKLEQSSRNKIGYKKD